ncbi:MAG: SLBB domain-containing protein [Planctomycetes bacterium]|nr:SLBB domain-containing protein [Planctomycetota bacterium]
MAESEIARKVREAGVVGAGGAGFPTHAKLSAQVDTYLVNCSECEPLLRVDRQVARRHADRVIAGLRACMQAVGATVGIVGIKAKYHEAIAALSAAAAAGTPAIAVREMEDFYPAGDEHVLTYELTGRVIPQGGLPLAVGVINNNVQTLINVSFALEGVPVTHKHVTVTGAVKSPLTARFPIGTSFREAVQLAGGPTIERFAVLDGGPMMGRFCNDLDVPITKTTNGILLLPPTNPVVQKHDVPIARMLANTGSTCHQCSACTDYCPRYLLGHELRPHLVMRTSTFSALGPMARTVDELNCCECGICDLYACPMDLTPRRVILTHKRELQRQKVRPTAAGQVGVREFYAERRIPLPRLVTRLALAPYDAEAPLREIDWHPRRVTIPRTMHLGAPATPVVAVGDRVKPGDLLGEIPQGALGARVHASIGGRVATIEPAFVIEAEP